MSEDIPGRQLTPEELSGTQGQFDSDFRKSNPQLHLLYVKWACKNLALIDSMIQQLNDQGSVPLSDMIIAMYKERDNLVLRDAAYCDASEILKDIKSAVQRSEE